MVPHVAKFLEYFVADEALEYLILAASLHVYLAFLCEALASF